MWKLLPEYEYSVQGTAARTVTYPTRKSVYIRREQRVSWIPATGNPYTRSRLEGNHYGTYILWEADEVEDRKRLNSCRSRKKKETAPACMCARVSHHACKHHRQRRTHYVRRISEIPARTSRLLSIDCFSGSATPISITRDSRLLSLSSFGRVTLPIR